MGHVMTIDKLQGDKNLEFIIIESFCSTLSTNIRKAMYC